jgi:lysophospholipid acyltransferase (LPLAT)-like uncharacterized protein
MKLSWEYEQSPRERLIIARTISKSKPTFLAGWQHWILPNPFSINKVCFSNPGIVWNSGMLDLGLKMGS